MPKPLFITLLILVPILLTGAMGGPGFLVGLALASMFHRAGEWGKPAWLPAFGC